MLFGIANQIVGIMFLKFPKCHKFLQDVPEVPHVPIVSELVWQQRITLVTFLYKLVTLPNNISAPNTGITSVKSFNKTLTD
jgi:hypothetical protein